jgi:methyl-accepting chemotaxis protein
MVTLVAIALTGTASAAQPASFSVGAPIVVASLASIVDGHFRTLEDSLDLVAATSEARSGDWARIKPLLERAGKANVEAGLAYATPSGSFWTIAQGRQTVSIADRPYFKTAMTGKTVVAEMVLSRTTGRPVANIAVPVKDASGKVTGVVIAAVYLDSLSKLVQQEMALDSHDIFFSFNANALVGLNWDQKQIFLEARKLSPDIDRAFGQMLAHDSGVESYTHRGATRTVVYRKSSYTGWWYAFGVVR